MNFFGIGVILILAITVMMADPIAIQEGFLTILKAVGLLLIAVPVIKSFMKSHKGLDRSKYTYKKKW